MAVMIQVEVFWVVTGHRHYGGLAVSIITTRLHSPEGRDFINTPISTEEYVASSNT